MALPTDDAARDSATGLVPKTRMSAGLGATATNNVIVTGINVGDTIYWIQTVDPTTGAVIDLDPADWVIESGATLTSATDDTSGKTVWVTFYDADLGETSGIAKGFPNT